MIAFASSFPESLSLHPTPNHGDGRCWIVRTDDGVSLFLTEAQADELAQLCWNRNTESKAA